MKHLTFLILTFFSFQFIISQNISVQLIEKSSNEPIPFASVRTGEHRGVISNEEGYFTINLNDLENNSIKISCMGYLDKTIDLETLKKEDYIIKLEQVLNQLNTVYISNKRPNIDSIIARAKSNVKTNYSTSLKKYHLFSRTTNYVDFENLDFEIDKATHVSKQKLAQANTDLQALTKAIMNSETIHFTDFKGTLYAKRLDSTKLVVDKATKLLDHNKNFSLKNVQERAQHILLSYLDTTKTYKVKTGLFKVEDSLSLAKELKEEQKREQKQELGVNSLKGDVISPINRSQYMLYNLLDTKLYDHEIDDVTTYNGNLTYVISYKPRKGKAKLSGKLFISDSDYAITRINFGYFENRHGRKLNLKLILGVKYEDNLYNGTIIYEKQKDNFYQPKYTNIETGSYFYVSRDLTLIQNSKERYKLSTDFKIEGSVRYKKELLISSTENMTRDQYKNITQEKNVPYQTLTKFDNSIWNNEETLEPLQEMKEFGVE
ncbi:carboxypeptidase-like regulatory domain-containing protein [Flavobacteriaceae bacterium XHP0103]|uniref:carboxypeptidase-like regulatory domain-containing protein n=1 Tax=Marixanthotalea marina TaxID=2844359 RepID=UPI002989C9B0|nr:carboxypeptidase-like regulatory domain-containing protein [Marixanthotalea marina]MBU3822608.1 carboxypeptidase-like regulatory domain-containing protein [Marixanthotalea marina]